MSLLIIGSGAVNLLSVAAAPWIFPLQATADGGRVQVYGRPGIDYALAARLAGERLAASPVRTDTPVRLFVVPRAYGAVATLLILANPDVFGVNLGYRDDAFIPGDVLVRSRWTLAEVIAHEVTHSDIRARFGETRELDGDDGEGDWRVEGLCEVVAQGRLKDLGEVRARLRAIVHPRLDPDYLSYQIYRLMVEHALFKDPSVAALLARDTTFVAALRAVFEDLDVFDRKALDARGEGVRPQSSAAAATTATLVPNAWEIVTRLRRAIFTSPRSTAPM